MANIQSMRFIILFQAMMENIHSHVFSLIDTYIKDHKERMECLMRWNLCHQLKNPWKWAFKMD